MNILFSCLILSFTALALFSTQAATSSHEYSVIGAIIDNTTRAGREAKVSIEMALDDISSKTNQSFHRHIINSQGEPVLAALAGKLYTYIFISSIYDLHIYQVMVLKGSAKQNKHTIFTTNPNHE